MLAASEGQTGCSSKTRGVFSGGSLPASPWAGALQAITIDTTANATSIGTQNSSTHGQAAASSNGVYGTWVGGKANITEVSSMTYITIDTHSSGFVSNFGNLTSARTLTSGASGDP